MKILGLILARGGSVRVPHKNIKPLGGKPLIYYIIQSAKKSRYINRIIVSTDDEKIAEIARKYGAEVPFYRPKEIAREDSPEFKAIEHALNWLRDNEKYVPDLVVKLFPTSPFLKPETIDKAIELMLANPGVDSLRSVRLCSEHPYKMWVIENNRLKSFVPLSKKPRDAHSLPYQVLPKVYIQNAAIDVIKPSNIWRKKSVIGTKILPLVMDEFESVDVNTPLDFVVAEVLLKEMRKRRVHQV
ncbi:MAG: acylneuraminate cytidylyltransferase family protein [Candidatus Hadarchaeales archaeon]